MTAVRRVTRRPIEEYRRLPVVVREHDPRAPAVARRLIALIATVLPDLRAEHIGSSAVPGLAGKNIIDLLLPTPAERVAAVAQALRGLGFQRQTAPEAFPPTRPMLQGAIQLDVGAWRVHVHVVPAHTAEVAELLGFRDALRADAALRREYVALKRAIVAEGVTDSAEFSRAKQDYIVATLQRRGIRIGGVSSVSGS